MVLKMKQIKDKKLYYFMIMMVLFAALLSYRFFEQEVSKYNTTLFALSYKYGPISRGLLGTIYSGINYFTHKYNVLFLGICVLPFVYGNIWFFALVVHLRCIEKMWWSTIQKSFLSAYLCCYVFLPYVCHKGDVGKTGYLFDDTGNVMPFLHYGGSFPLDGSLPLRSGNDVSSGFCVYQHQSYFGFVVL